MNPINTNTCLMLAFLNRCEEINHAYDKELDLAMRNAGSLEALRMDIQRLGVGKDNAKRYAREDMERAMERVNARADSPQG